MRDPEDNRIHKDKQEKLRERGQRHFDDDLAPGSHGVVIHKPVGYNPNPNARNFGKLSSGTHSGIEIFGQNGYGMRRDDMMPSQGFSPKGNVFWGHDDTTFIMEESTLMGSNHQSSGTTVDVCDVSCGPMEFFCSKACSCIQNDLHCGKYNNQD
jgi:hypothetical protein